VLFDRQGRVAAIYAGAQSSSDLAPALQQLTTEH
jgi:recombinational DNA repair protein (RecF pathway)